MRKYAQRIRPAEKYNALIEVKCDLCEKITSNEWRKDCYDATETEVSLKTGTSFPDGGSGDKITIDICPECFITKLLPWIKSQGGEPTIENWDY